MGLKVLAAFTKIHEAYLAKNQLEMEGIQSFLFDEYIIGVHPFYSNAVGGVKLVVPESEFEKAEVIIKNYLEQQREYLELACHRCPNCNSTNIRRKSVFHIVFNIVFIFIFGILWVIFYRKNKCNECGHRQAW
jgi:hypothetical protein